MNIVASVAKNTFARSAAEIVNRVSSALFWILVTRFLGPSGLGVIAVSMSLASVFGMIATLGLGSLVIREVAKDKRNSSLYFTGGLVLGSLGTITAMAAMVAFVTVMKYEPHTAHACYIMTLTLVPYSLFYWSRAVLFGYEKMEYAAYARTLENAVKVGGGLLLLLRGYGVMELVWLILLSRSVSALFIASCVKAKIRIGRLHLDGAKLREMLRHVPIFFGTTLFNSAFWSASIIVVSKVGGIEAAGLYGAAYKLVDIILCFSAAFGQAIFPVVSRLSRVSEALFHAVCRESLKLVTVLNIAIATGGTLLADRIVTAVYGQEMIGAAWALQILIWSAVPFGAIPVLAYSLVSRSLQKYDMISNLIAFASILTLSILMTKMTGIVGAAAAALIATAAFAVSQFLFVNRRLFRIELRAPVAKPFLAAAVMAVFIVLCRHANLVLLVAFGAAIYLLMILVTRTVSEGDRLLYRQLRML